jgi:hypothetical protein
VFASKPRSAGKLVEHLVQQEINGAVVEEGLAMKVRG